MEIGELSLKTEGVTAEWTLREFFSYYTVEDEWYRSPTFSVPGSRWYLSLHDSVGWVDLYLCRVKDSTYPKRVVWSFGVKKADGTVEERVSGVATHVFPNDGEAKGCPVFLHRSELLKRKSELMPSGALTVTCTLRVEDNLDATWALMKLSQDLKDVYISQNCPDTMLRVKNRHLPVHRAVLGGRSPVFRTLFEVDMKEKNTGVVDIADCPPEVFQDFLVYLYTGQFENSSRKVFDLYRVADKYAVEELKSECVRSMLSNLTISNVLDVVYLAHQFNENELKIKAQEFFDENFTEICITDRWLSFSKKDLKLAYKLTKEMVMKLRADAASNGTGR